MKTTMQDYKKLLGIGSLLVVMVVLIDTFIRSYRVQAMIRACTLAFGELDSIQKDSIKRIVQAFNQYGDKDLNKLVYILATARHESNFRPIQEYRAKPSQSLIYNRQNKYWYTGYYGRGYVQLTHKRNYQKMSNFLGVDLVNNPSLALDPKYAAKILVYGMLNGMFTRHPLSSYINSTKIDFYNARKVVNGLDKAPKIALYAVNIAQSMK